MSLIALILSAALVGIPVHADLGGYLERSAEAEFSGEQLVKCATPDGSRSSVFNLAQRDGTVIAWGGEGTSVVSVAPGLSMTAAGGDVEASLVEGSPGVASDLYAVGETTSTIYLGRPATEVSLQREGAERVRLTVDEATDAVIRTQSFTEEGDVYCDRRLLSFTPDLSDVPSVVADAGVESSTPLDQDPDVLPDTAAGFELIDTYQVDGGTLSYYSDGFFSTGVVVTSRPITFGPDRDVVVVTSASGEYQRSYGTGTVTVTWAHRDDNLAVITDVPPDLVEAFIEDMPTPTKESFFDRIWGRIFG